VNKDRVLQKFRSVMILLDSFVYRKHRPEYMCPAVLSPILDYRYYTPSRSAISCGTTTTVARNRSNPTL
jgi:hypothetical protein